MKFFKKRMLLLVFLFVSPVFVSGNPGGGGPCMEGSSWQCINVAKYASGDCAYYQGNSCLWCDCFAD